MYSKCISCSRLGETCTEFNPFAMTGEQLREWCKKRLTWLRMSRATLIELSGVPKSTIDRYFSTEPCDFKFETIRPILKILVGGNWDEHDCPSTDMAINNDHLHAENEHLHTECIRLQEENERLRQHFLEQEKTHNADMAKFRENTANALILFKEQIKTKNTAITVLSIALAVLTVAVLAVLVYDRLNPAVGWFRY